MTSNQISYQTLKETERTNRANEELKRIQNDISRRQADAAMLRSESEAFKTGFSAVKTLQGVAKNVFGDDILHGVGGALDKTAKAAKEKVAQFGSALGAGFTNLANTAAATTFDPVFLIIPDMNRDGKKTKEDVDLWTSWLFPQINPTSPKM